MLLLAVLLQGPAMLTQELAWARMLVEYSAERGVVRGVVETFDGEHPCAMCHQAQQMRVAQRRPDQPEDLPREALLRWSMEWSKLLPPCHRLLREPDGVDLQLSALSWVRLLSGRDAAAPPLPPPRWGGLIC